MTYEEVVLMVRDLYENADAREVFEHIAIQFNVTGEAEGAFYVEVADRQICVEPYEYYDRDLLVTIDTEVLVGLLKHKLNYADVIQSGAIQIAGNMEKYALLSKVKLEMH